MKIEDNERLMLSLPRLAEVPEEAGAEAPFTEYFSDIAQLLIAAADDCGSDFERIKERWEDPAYAVRHLGEEYGPLLSAVCFEMMQGLRAVYADCPHARERYTLLVELFLELYGEFSCGTPGVRTVRRIFTDYLTDYLPDYESWYLEARLSGGQMNFPMPIVLSVSGEIRDPAHAEDLAVVLDEEFVSRRKRVLRETLKEMQKQKKTAGLRCFIEERKQSSGETVTVCERKPAFRLSDLQLRLYEEMGRSLCEILERFAEKNIPE
ncbi:MAG: hypothetical protein Q4B15_04085 [Lachnospiraceae bacterium]|nr:hypothetical protein [Lachnospiraceae bacterium]